MQAQRPELHKNVVRADGNVTGSSAKFTVGSGSGPFLADEIGILPRLAVAVDRDRRHGFVGGLLGQAGESHAELVLLELDRLAGREEARRLHLVHQAAERHRLTRPEVDVHVKGIALARETRVIAAARLADVGFVDRFPAPLPRAPTRPASARY